MTSQSVDHKSTCDERIGIHERMRGNNNPVQPNFPLGLTKDQHFSTAEKRAKH